MLDIKTLTLTMFEMGVPSALKMCETSIDDCVLGACLTLIYHIILAELWLSDTYSIYFDVSINGSHNVFVQSDCAGANDHAAGDGRLVVDF
jgi:hypothetical protein